MPPAAESPVCRVWLWPCASIAATVDALTERLQSLGAHQHSKQYSVHCELVTVRNNKPSPSASTATSTTAATNPASYSLLPQSREFYRLEFPSPANGSDNGADSESYSKQIFLIAPKFVLSVMDGAANFSLSALSSSVSVRSASRIAGHSWDFGDFIVSVGSVRSEKPSAANYCCMEIAYRASHAIGPVSWQQLGDAAAAVLTGVAGGDTALASFRPANSWPIFVDFSLSEYTFTNSHRALLYSFAVGLIKAGGVQ